MKEPIPGLRRWTMAHPKIGIEVSSHWLVEAGALFDPLVPEEGIEAFREAPPRRILLSNRHHLRQSEAIAGEYGCTIHCSKPGLHEFERGPEVRGFEFGERPAPGVEAIEIGAICPDETALLLEDAGALLVADGIMAYGGELAFVSDGLLGDDPEAVQRGLREAFSRALERDFDSLLFAHGDPRIGDGKEALTEFCAR